MAHDIKKENFMKKNKIVNLFIIVLLLLIAGGVYLGSASHENLRNMGFPSLTAVPDGFSPVNAKSIDAGDWCEITYENNRGDFLSLDCYELGTFDTSFLMNYAKSTEKITIKNKEATIYKNLSGNNINIIAWQDESNNALCLVGGNVSMDEMVQVAENIKYDMKKVVIKSENSKISTYPQERGTIEDDSLKKISEVLKCVTNPLFEKCMENDKAILKFELESFYKSFDFSILDDLLVEVFDYEYFMKADDNVLIAGGMVRDEEGNIRGFTGSFGQIATISRDGQLIKVLPVTNQDVKLDPEGADEEKLDWIKEKLMTSMKSPSYLIRNTLYN